MLAVNQVRSSSPRRFISSQSRSKRLRLLKGVFSARSTSRQYPILAGLHRGIDGALVGSFVAVVFMSALTLHWQYLWTVAFARLESSRSLSHRLMDSTAILERHFLQNTLRPESLVPTTTSDLVYIDNPFFNSNLDQVDKTKIIELTLNETIPKIYGY